VITNFSGAIVLGVKIDGRNAGEALLNQNSLQGRDRKIIRFVRKKHHVFKNNALAKEIEYARVRANRVVNSKHPSIHVVPKLT
jgi:hypothetical protein